MPEHGPRLLACREWQIVDVAELRATVDSTNPSRTGLRSTRACACWYLVFAPTLMMVALGSHASVELPASEPAIHAPAFICRHCGRPLLVVEIVMRERPSRRCKDYYLRRTSNTIKLKSL